MARTLSRIDATANIDEVIDSIDRDKATTILDDRGLPTAIVVSPEEFLALRHDRFWTYVDRIRERNTEIEEEQGLEELNRVIDEVRQARRGN